MSSAGTRLDQGDRILKSCRQTCFQARAAQDSLTLPGRDQLALDDQVLKWHCAQIGAQNMRAGNRDR